MSLTIPQLVPNGTYRIKSALKSDHYLDYQSNGQYDVRPIVNNPNSDTQKWKIAGSTAPADINSYTITNLSSGLSLSFQQGKDKDGNNIWRLKAFTEGSAWTLEPRAGDEFVIGFVGNEQCVDYADGGGDDWGIVWDRNNLPNQRWILEPLNPITPPSPGSALDGATVTFTNFGAGTVLDLDGGQKTNGTPVIGYEDHNGDNQHWKLTKIADKGGSAVWPSWTIQNVASGTYMNLTNGSAANQTKIVGWAAAAGNPNQMWYLVSANADGGVYAIQNVGTGTYVDLYNGAKDNNTPVNGWAGPSGTLQSKLGHQLWTVTVTK